MAPYLHQFSAVELKMHLFVLFGINPYSILLKSIIIKKIDAETAVSKGAIWDEYSEQHQH